ncbi:MULTISPECIES: hypothetical protein [Methylobacterium]|uniref:hypothetical protein n=1 Tax=Methylobacterium TaxID=407 RepID=UPI000A821861|nr:MULTISPECIES: hypothetical protein [Methylobacterium]MCI9880590.1 hypothetical protein [Methylobacterium goesingense]
MRLRTKPNIVEDPVATGPVRRIRERFARTPEAVFGLALGAIGTPILTDGLREIVRR